jgi:hypothetical protein
MQYDLAILMALNKMGKHVYPGTVHPAVIENRRKRNRQAARQRRINRTND